MVNASNSSSRGQVEYYGGQEGALAQIFAPGGAFSQFMQGKPNAGFDRAKAVGLQQIEDANTAQGIGDSPLGTRMKTDYLAKATQMAGDNWFNDLFKFMQPAGSKSKSSSSSWGVL